MWKRDGPWPAASQAAQIVFLHSLPDASKGVTAPEAALALARPGVDLAYVDRGLEETERGAWYMRREGDHYLFRTRASVNKRYQERLGQVESPEVRQNLDEWIDHLYSGFSVFHTIPFPDDHMSIPDQVEKNQLAIVHYDTECAMVGQGAKLNFTAKVFATAGANQSPRVYRNNIVFLLAESSRVAGMKTAVRSLIAWERVAGDIEKEQGVLAGNEGTDFNTLRERVRKGESGVPAEFNALSYDLDQVRQNLGSQELNVRTKILEAYRVLAFPQPAPVQSTDMFSAPQAGAILECYRVDFGELPEKPSKKGPNPRQKIAETPILQCLRQSGKLMEDPTNEKPVVLAPKIIKDPPLWRKGEGRISTEEVWLRIRKEPDLPLVLEKKHLLPSFREGLKSEPDSLWVYYDQKEKKVYNRENADVFSPVISAEHFLYDPAEANKDRVWPVTSVDYQDIDRHLWPKKAGKPEPSATAKRISENAMNSPHFPVMPAPDTFWDAFKDGVRANTLVLRLVSLHTVIGASEMLEWPHAPKIEDDAELWIYDEACKENLYPRKGRPRPPTPPILHPKMSSCIAGLRTTRKSQ